MLMLKWGVVTSNLVCKALAQIGHVALTPRMRLPNARCPEGLRVPPGALGLGHNTLRALFSQLI